MTIASPGFLLFSGTNDRALIALCRGLQRYEVPFGLIGRGKDDLLKRSRYVGSYLLDRTSETLHLKDILAAAENARKIYRKERWVICPTSEYLNLVLFPMRDRLEREGITVATCEQGLYTLISEKSTFRSYADAIGVPPPEIIEHASARIVDPPFVAKPINNLSRTGRILYPYLVRDWSEEKKFRSETTPEEYYLERFVKGESWYLLFYVAADGSVTMGAQRNYVQQGLGKSIVVARSFPYPDPLVQQRFAERFISDGYRGFIMVEVRRTGPGRAISIEANPRCWGPLQLTMDSRMGLVEAFLRDYGYVVPVQDAPVQGRFYCWSGGIVQALRSGKGIDRHISLPAAVLATFRAVYSDVYARRDSWSCFSADLCRS